MTPTENTEHLSNSMNTLAERLASATDAARSAAEDINAVAGELEDWLSNLPEGLNSGDLADRLEEARSQLETSSSEIDSAADAADEADIPGAYGR
jgi:ABC-type transporter Mla subunit MlaD